jgi:hypothetical protein
MDETNGLLVPLQNQSLSRVACRARLTFEQERGVKAGQYCLNPVHRPLLPADMRLEGLPVRLDPVVRENHLLICAGESKTPGVQETSGAASARG